MEIFAISALINGIVALGFGTLVFFKNSKALINVLFFLMTLALTLWAFSYWQWMSSGDATTAIFWVRVLSIGSLLIPVFFFHWVLAVLKEIRGVKKIVLVFAYVFVLASLSFSFSQYFIVDVEQKLYFRFWPNPGIVYTLYFFVIYIGLILYSLYLLIARFLTSVGERKNQILYIILGAIFGFGGGLSNFFLWYDIPIPPYGNFLVVLFPFFLSYSIVKYHFFNIKTIATEILVVFILITLFIQILLANSLFEMILRGTFFTLVAILGYLLIQSVYREVQTREEIEMLAEDLEKANVRLKELDRLKSEFVSIASHQLRSPLTSIGGYASLILEGSFGEVSKAVKEAVKKIFDSSGLMMTSVGDFLDVSRIEQGKMDYHFEIFDIRKLTELVVEELRPTAQKKGLALSFNTSENGRYNIKADYSKIKQVLNNLIDNAIKYTVKGSVTVGVSKKEESKKVLIAIADTGMGISKETLSKLFDKFVRARNANTVNVTGTGLGLYVVKEMIKAHKGKVWAESDGEGSGATFYVELNSHQD